MLYGKHDKWKAIENPLIVSGRYAVSNFGEVINLKTGKVLAKTKHPNGYYMVQLKLINGQAMPFLMHRLVAEAFVDGKDDVHNVVNHKNGIKTDCRDVNLEWVSPSENVKHAYDTGLKVPEYNLPESDRDKVCKVIVECDGAVSDIVEKLKKEYNIEISKNMIQQIKRKNAWATFSDKYFDKSRFEYTRHMTESQIRRICKLLVKYKGSIKLVYNEIVEDIPFATYARIASIKNKIAHKSISDDYF